MGGHSAPRTYRPSTGMAGSEMVYAITKLTKSLAKNEKSDSLRLLFGVRLQRILTGPNNEVVGVVLANVTADGTIGEEYELKSRNVVLSTGGFAADLDADSLIKQYRPELMKFQTTNGPFATGDGHKVAIAAGAATIDMDQVQVGSVPAFLFSVDFVNESQFGRRSPSVLCEHQHQQSPSDAQACPLSLRTYSITHPVWIGRSTQQHLLEVHRKRAIVSRSVPRSCGGLARFWSTVTASDLQTSWESGTTWWPRWPKPNRVQTTSHLR